MQDSASILQLTGGELAALDISPECTKVLSPSSFAANKPAAMARVYLLSAAPPQERTDYNLSLLRSLETSARADMFGIHKVVDDPHNADLILFADLLGAGMHFELIRRHPLVKRYREKCFLFCSNAYVIPFLPGVYASLEKRWSSSRTRGGFHTDTLQNEFASYTSPTADLPYLFSFIGAVSNAPVRYALAALSHPRGFVRDTTEEFDRVSRARMTQREARDYHRQYVEVTKVSKFVLCPRGLGAATIRLIETMRMGRVPVIISDAWVPPTGPDWERFSIRVPEAGVVEIPRILEEREHEAVVMGQLARRQWEEWFSQHAAFHRVVEWCLDIRARRRVPEAIARLPVFMQLLRPFHLKYALRQRYHSVRARLLASRASKIVPQLAGSVAQGEGAKRTRAI